MVTTKYNDFTIAELQHIFVGLLLAKKYAFISSTIIDELTDEVAFELDRKIKEAEDAGE